MKRNSELGTKESELSPLYVRILQALLKDVSPWYKNK